MSSRQAGRVVADINRVPARHHHHPALGGPDSDAFVLTMLTVFATMIALYDLLILATLHS